MKTIWKKNQFILTVLAVVIAVAGYLTYTGETGTLLDAAAVGNDQAVQGDALTDISEEDILAENMALENAAAGTGQEGENNAQPGGNNAQPGGNSAQPGEALLTSSQVVDFIAEVQLNREQVRTRNQETLMEIINNASLGEEQKQSAVDNMVRMTEIAEKENATETLLATKGFDSAVVSITENNVDVVLGMTAISDAERAQVEDIVKRKTEMPAESITISLLPE